MSSAVKELSTLKKSWHDFQLLVKFFCHREADFETELYEDGGLDELDTSIHQELALVTSTKQKQQQPANILAEDLPTIQAKKTTRSLVNQTNPQSQSMLQNMDLIKSLRGGMRKVTTKTNLDLLRE